jgi:hypothetical protein
VCEFLTRLCRFSLREGTTATAQRLTAPASREQIEEESTRLPTLDPDYAHFRRAGRACSVGNQSSSNMTHPILEGLRSTTVGKHGTRSIYIETCASFTKAHGPWRLTYRHRDVCIIYKDVASPSAPHMWNLHAGRGWHAGK